MKQCKILVIPNTGISKLENDFSVEKNTGEFAFELQTFGNIVTFYGQIIKEVNNIHTYKILENKLRIKGLNRQKNKILNYILLYLRIIPEVFKSDFIYIFYPTSFKYVTFLCKILNKKYGLYIRGMEDMHGTVSYWIYKHSFAVFTVSDYFTSFVNKVTLEEKASTIRPMLPFSEKDIISDRKYNRNKHYNILFLGRIAKEKGIQELIYAAEKIKEKRKDFIINIVGDGEYYEHAENLIQRLDLTEHINLLGGIYDTEQIKKNYLQSDIYILPTYHEGFPRTLYEAMIFGTPIVTTFVGGISSIMKDMYNCLEIKPKSIESITSVLIFAMDNYSLMMNYAENGKKTVNNIVNSTRLSHARELNNKIKRAYE
ncbi:Glycosyltransferase Gtf1 [anaerobic digester metagenome]